MFLLTENGKKKKSWWTYNRVMVIPVPLTGTESKTCVAPSFPTLTPYQSPYNCYVSMKFKQQSNGRRCPVLTSLLDHIKDGVQTCPYLGRKGRMVV